MHLKRLAFERSVLLKSFERYAQRPLKGLLKSFKNLPTYFSGLLTNC